MAGIIKLQSRQISKNLSIYLDLMRFTSALIVFLTHTNSFLMPVPGKLGREAVAVFFVLSGFVISYVVSEKETGWRSYAVARMARIYPVAILALLVTFVADHIGMAFNPAIYAGEFYHQPSLGGLLASLTFVNQIWFSHTTFGSNEPYWSLGFEVQYYLFFALISYLPRTRAILAISLWTLICGPKVLMYLPLWLLGVVGQRLVASHFVKSKILGGALFLLSLVIFAGTWATLVHSATNMFETFTPAKEAINFVYFTSLGLAVMLNIVGFNAMFDDNWVCPQLVAKTIRWVAGGSFTLYLVHQPILVMLSSIVSTLGDHKAAKPLAVVVALVLIYLLAEVAERRKKVFSVFFNKMVAIGFGRGEVVPRAQAAK